MHRQLIRFMEKFPINIPLVPSVRVAEAVDGARKPAFLHLTHLLTLLDLFVSSGAKRLREGLERERGWQRPCHCVHDSRGPMECTGWVSHSA